MVPVPTDRGGSPYELVLALSDSQEGYGGELEFNTDLFDLATAERFWADLVRLLDAVIADPDRRVGLDSDIFSA